MSIRASGLPRLLARSRCATTLIPTWLVVVDVSAGVAVLFDVTFLDFEVMHRALTCKAHRNRLAVPQSRAESTRQLGQSG